MATPKDGCNVTTDSPSPFTTNEMPASDALLSSTVVMYCHERCSAAMILLVDNNVDIILDVANDDADRRSAAASGRDDS